MCSKKGKGNNRIQTTVFRCQPRRANTWVRHNYMLTRPQGFKPGRFSSPGHARRSLRVATLVQIDRKYAKRKRFTHQCLLLSVAVNPCYHLLTNERRICRGGVALDTVKKENLNVIGFLYDCLLPGLGLDIPRSQYKNYFNKR